MHIYYSLWLQNFKCCPEIFQHQRAPKTQSQVPLVLPYAPSSQWEGPPTRLAPPSIRIAASHPVLTLKDLISLSSNKTIIPSMQELGDAPAPWYWKACLLQHLLVHFNWSQLHCGFVWVQGSPPQRLWIYVTNKLWSIPFVQCRLLCVWLSLNILGWGIRPKPTRWI